VLGDSNRNIEFRARWVSAVAGALSVPLLIGVVFLWRRQWTAAWLAGLLLAVNPFHLWYSQEVRASATMLCFGLLTLLAYELARLSGKRHASGSKRTSCSLIPPARSGRAK